MVLTKVFATVFVFGKFIVFVFVFKYYAVYLDQILALAFYMSYTYLNTVHMCIYVLKK